MASRLPKKATLPVTQGRNPPAHITPRRKPALLCTGCGKPTSQVFTPNQCARCKATAYCSRRCQASDWPFHKRVCNKSVSRLASVHTPPNPLIKSTNHTQMSADIVDPRIMTGPEHWFGRLAEMTCYHLIIDTYRLRLDSEWGNVERFCNGDYEMLLTHFHEFLEGAMATRVLPRWWGEDNMIACVRVAIDETADACILHTVEGLKQDIAYKYSTNEMPEQLLLMAERVYGWREAY